MSRLLVPSAAAIAAAIVSLGSAAAPVIASPRATPTKSTKGTPTSGPRPAPSPPAPAPTAPGALVIASATLHLPDVFVVGHYAVSVPGRRVQVTGSVRPYVPGQKVTVKAFLGRKLVKSDVLSVRPSANGQSGQFSERLMSHRSGVLVVKMVHSRTAAMQGFLAQRRIGVLDEKVGFGSTGRFVQLIQQRLTALHLYVPQTGVYDQQTGLAIGAYHRLLHQGTAQTLSGVTISDLLNGVGTFKVRYPHDGAHVEGNLSNQLLALIYGAKVYRIYPISSGKPSTPTILGHFHVYLRDPGYLPDGMYYSDFFYGGYAIHGYAPAPDYPASHGCMRLPIVDAISVFDWLTYGDVVDVYG